MSDIEHRIREQLNALPEVPLPEALWQRVERRRRSRLVRNRLAASVTAFALVGLLSFKLLLPTVEHDGVEKGQEEAQQVAATSLVPAQADAQADIRAIDHALQTAYDRGATDAEVAPIWAAREALLAGGRSGRPPVYQNRS